MPLLTTNEVAIRITAIIALAEFLIMLMFPVLPQRDSVTLAALDVALLVVFTTPPIYYWVVTPFVQARDEALAQVNRLASIDSLTQLANRRQMSERLEPVARGGATQTVHGALLLVDLDGFKLVNDVHGHDLGDAVLVAIAQRLQSITRSEDVAGRLGGDEFIVLVNRLDADERIAHDKAIRVAQKLIEVVNQPVEVNGKTIHVGASVGIRLLGFDALDAATAIREADIAMYRAKQDGKGRIEFFERSRPSRVA